MQVKYGSENLSAWLRQTCSLIGASCLFGQSHDGWKSELLRYGLRMPTKKRLKETRTSRGAIFTSVRVPVYLNLRPDIAATVMSFIVRVSAIVLSLLKNILVELMSNGLKSDSTTSEFRKKIPDIKKALDMVEYLQERRASLLFKLLTTIGFYLSDRLWLFYLANRGHIRVAACMKPEE